MAKTDIFKEYIWLVETIYNARAITLTEINERWVDTEMSGGVEIPRTTFNRHRADVAEIFGIHIECNRKTNEYYIMNRRDLSGEKVANWLMTTLSVSNMLTESVGLKDRILLESAPLEGWMLSRVKDAMKRNLRLDILYQKYGETTATERIVEPYCLKLYHRGWYVLCKDGDTLKVFGFDRIKDIRVTDEHFHMDKDFDAEEYFGSCFGVVNRNDVGVETVVLRAFGNEAARMKSLPVHKSQMLLRDGDGWSEFELKLKPTDDFQSHILGRAGWVKVMKPEWLAEKIKESARMILEGKEPPLAKRKK